MTIEERLDRIEAALRYLYQVLRLRGICTDDTLRQNCNCQLHDNSARAPDHGWICPVHGVRF